jgi:AcrR family transcriptional regulator
MAAAVNPTLASEARAVDVIVDVNAFLNILSGNARANDGAPPIVRFGTSGRDCPETGRRPFMAGTAKKEDRRIQRTRRLLLQALFALLGEKGFDDVTVQDIIDRANVGRSTFYVHFVDKEDLLVQAMDPFSAGLKERQRQALRQRGGSAPRAFAFSRELFAHAEGHRDVFRAVAGRQSAPILERHFRRMQVDLVREEVKAMAPVTAAGAALLEPVVQSVAGALHGLVAWWIDGKRRMTVDEVSELFSATAIAAVRAAFGAAA